MMTDLLKTILFYTLIVVLIGGLLLLISPTREFGYSILSIALIFGQLAGLTLYLLETDIHKTKYLRFISIGIALFLIGTVIKILHWPGSFYIIMLSIAIILITYSFRFFKKKSKCFLDYIKLIWLICAVTGYIFQLNHWIPGYQLLLVSFGIFWIGIIKVIYDSKISLYIKK